MKNERESVVDYRRACNIPHLSPVYNRYAARDIDRVDKSECFPADSPHGFSNCEFTRVYGSGRVAAFEKNYRPTGIKRYQSLAASASR